MASFGGILPASWWAQFRDARLRRFWILAGIAVLLHTVGDAVSTYLAVVVYEVGYETNRAMAGPLNESLVAFLIAYSPVFLVSGAVLIGFAGLFAHASDAEIEQVTRWAELVWLGIIVWGMALVGNNLLVLSRAFV